jgi:GTP-binding protein EngB required for normal cell division
MQIIHFLKNKKNITQYFEFAATEFAPAKILETKNDNIKNQSKQKKQHQTTTKQIHPPP